MFRSFVRALRFLGLLLTIGLAFLATPTFALRPFGTLLPTDLFASYPSLLQLQRWLIEDVTRLSLLLTGWTALAFGLLAAPWPFDAIPRAPAPPTQHKPRRYRGLWRTLGLLFVFLAIAATVSMAVLQETAATPTIIHGLWLASILCLLLAAGLLTAPAPTVSPPAPYPHPTRGWGGLLLLLLLMLGFYSWQLATIPITIDDATANLGLQAAALAQGETTALFAVEPTLAQPDNLRHTFALAPTALLVWLTGDLLFSTRFMGVLMALLCGGATWLLAGELFDRRPHMLPSGILLEDNGQLPAIIATVLVLVNSAILYYSQGPIVLDAVAWGTLGCWALLRGQRTNDRLAMTLSGVLLGVAYLFHGSALAFGLTALFWWLGLAAMRTGRLPHRVAQPNHVGVLVGDLLLWLFALYVATAPVLLSRSQEVSLWINSVPTSVSGALSALFTNLAPPLNLYPAPFLNPILLPFLPLTLGVLLFNLDRRQGWLIGSWLGSVLLTAIVADPRLLRWEILLPLAPAIAVAVAFTIDRLRVSLITSSGGWIQQFLAYSLLGMLLWVAFHNLTTQATFLVSQSDRTSALGYALRALPADQPVIVQLPATEGGLTAATAAMTLPLRFLTNERVTTDNSIRFVDTVPAGLAPGTAVLFFPEATATQQMLRATYPTGTLHVQRDRLANPVISLYLIPPVVE